MAKDRVADKVPVVLPEMLAKVTESEGSRWYLFQVPGSMSWAEALEGARLQLTPSVALQAPKSGKPVCAMMTEESLHTVLPLKPTKPGSYKLVAANNIQAMVTIRESTPMLQAADDAATSAAREEAAAERKRHAMQARTKADKARRRTETRQRCGIPPLQEVFEYFGLPLEKFDKVLAEDNWSGRGRDPSKAFDGPDAEAAPEAEEAPLHLKPVRLVEGQGTVPLLIWRLCGLTAEGREKLVFRCYSTMHKERRKMSLLCNCADAPRMLLHGNRVRRSSQTDFRYLVGGQAPGSRRVFIFEADVYSMARNRPFDVRDGDKDESDYEEEAPEIEEEDGPQLTYREQRNRATAAFGVAKRQRDTEKAAEKAKKRKFMELATFATSLTKRAEDLEANLVDAQARSEENRRKILPPYNADAAEPRMIYQEGLKTIAPPHLLQEEQGLLDPEMVAFLKKVAREPLRANEVNDITKRSKLLAAVISARFKHGAAGFSEQDANTMAVKCEVLCRLVKLYKAGPRFMGGQYKAKGVASLCELHQDSALAKHWHMTYHSELPGNPSNRTFNGRKLLPAMLVYSLYLTPGLSLELNVAELEGELKTSQMQKTFENIGCTVTMVTPPAGAAVSQQFMSVALAHPPMMDLEKYQQQNLLSSKKGRGRGRGRGRK